MKYALGYIRDETDDRDRPFDPGTLSNTLRAPESVALFDMGRALDQGPIGSCVAHSVAKALAWAQFRQGGKESEELASRLALYYWSRAAHGREDVDSGTYLRTTFRVLNKLGFPPESSWPYDPTRWQEKPDANVVRMAFDQKPDGNLVSYRKIFATDGYLESALKLALSNGHPVVVGTRVDDTFMRGRGTWPGLRGPILGGHAVVLGGYDEEGVWFLNSWGEEWGNRGWGKMTWVATRRHLEDVWVVEAAPGW